MISSWYFGEDLAYEVCWGHPPFPSQKRSSLPSLAIRVLASCKGECYILVLTPSHQPASRQASWSFQSCFPGGSPCGHILGNLRLFKTLLLFPKPDAAFPPSHTLATLSATKRTNKGLSQCKVGPQMSHLSERQAAEFCLCCSKGPCSWISVGYFDLAVRWCAGEKDVWLVRCRFELEEKMARSLH